MPFEHVGGERFTSVEPTPLLAACIDAAHETLAAALADVSPPVDLFVRKSWEFGPGTELSPSLMVTRASHEGNGHGPHVPLLVAEFRTESTGRYVLGPKRMVYSRFRVPEFWYVDPMNRRVAVLRPHEGGDYSWPPDEFGAGDALEPKPFPGVAVDVDALLGPSFSDGSRARHAGGGEPWLAS